MNEFLSTSALWEKPLLAVAETREEESGKGSAEGDDTGSGQVMSAEVLQNNDVEQIVEFTEAARKVEMAGNQEWLTKLRSKKPVYVQTKNVVHTAQPMTMRKLEDLKNVEQVIDLDEAETKVETDIELELELPVVKEVQVSTKVNAIQKIEKSTVEQATVTDEVVVEAVPVKTFEQQTSVEPAVSIEKVIPVVVIDQQQQVDKITTAPVKSKTTEVFVEPKAVEQFVVSVAQTIPVVNTEAVVVSDAVAVSPVKQAIIIIDQLDEPVTQAVEISSEPSVTQQIEKIIAIVEPKSVVKQLWSESSLVIAKATPSVAVETVPNLVVTAHEISLDISVPAQSVKVEANPVQTKTVLAKTVLVQIAENESEAFNYTAIADSYDADKKAAPVVINILSKPVGVTSRAMENVTLQEGYLDNQELLYKKDESYSGTHVLDPSQTVTGTFYDQLYPPTVNRLTAA